MMRLFTIIALTVVLGARPVDAQSVVPGSVTLRAIPSPRAYVPADPAPAEVSLEAPPHARQERGPRRLKGALIGGGVGLVAGGLLGGLTSSSDTGDDLGGTITDAALTAEGVLLGALVGGALGAILGATVFAPGGA